MKQLAKRLVFGLIYCGKCPKHEVLYVGDEVKDVRGHDVALVIASDGRQEILAKVVRQFLEVECRKLAVIAITSESDYQFLVSQSDIAGHLVVLRAPNFPLGYKWQSAVDVARSFVPKVVLITGSDDIVDRAYIEEGLKILGDGNGVDCVATSSWIVYDSHTFYQVETNPSFKSVSLGAGRLYSAALLDKFEWKLFEPTFNTGLDLLGGQRVEKYSDREVYLNNSKGFVVSVKGEWGMLNTFEAIKQSKKFTVSKVSLDSKRLASLQQLIL